MGRPPGSVADAREYFAAVRPELRSSDWARDAIRFVLEPPLTRELLPFQVPIRVMANAALALIPRDLRQLAGIDRPRALDAAALAAVRPLLAIGSVPGARNLFGLATGRQTQELLWSRSRAPLSRAA